jgi:23S rRNA pseudouridine1911/1915/1917 synthase
VRDIKLAPQNIPLDILYEDEYLVAVNKPSGLVVHPGNGVRDGTLVNALLHKIGTLSEGSGSERPGIVHRLDKETSGVMIAAKTNNAHAAMAAAFANRSVEKHYVGFCFGEPSESHGRIDLALERSRRDPLKRTSSKNGKPSLTEYWLLRYRAGVSAIYFKLHTGRTHQIRVHCSSKGFPILADSLYGGGRERLMRVAPLDRPFAAKVFKSFSRQALHARYLSFIHPFTGLRVHIEAPFPEDFHSAMIHFGDHDLFRAPPGLTK